MLALVSVTTLGFSLTARAAIYGNDDRQEVRKVPRIAGPASSVAVAVGSNLISKNSDGTSKIQIFSHYGEGMCRNERFVGQPSIGVCSGFLLSDRILVTAGHCGMPTGMSVDPNHPFCENFSWIFGYALDKEGKTNDQRIPADKIYTCKRLIRAENIEPVSPSKIYGNDFMILELDRPVSGDIVPAKIATKPVKPSELVYTVGFPIGLPAKYSGLSPVIALNQPHYFEVNLDSLSGNSGGGVFNSRNEIVGILVSGHPVDFSKDPASGCERANVCDLSGRKCRQDSTFGVDQVSNFVQKIETILPYLPK